MLTGRTAVALTLLGAGCTGDIFGPGAIAPGARAPASPPNPTQPTPLLPGAGLLRPCTPAPQPSPGASPLRRLSRVEYDNTVRDLLADTSRPADGFPGENTTTGYDNDAESMVVTDLLAEQYLSAAEALADAASPDTLVPCDVAATGATGCAQKFIASFGAKAFRRPLDDAEAQRFLGVYQAGRAQQDSHLTALRTVLAGMLISPSFLYRVELGAPPSGTAPQQLTGYERASRLSYFLWGSMPDSALFAAAAAGQLDTPAGVAAQTARLLQDPRAHDAVAHFQAQWLWLNRLDNVSKDTTLFPDFDALRPSMKKETETFLDDAFWRGGTLGELFTSTRTFVDGALASFYGIAATSPASLAGTPRVGLLTQASLLATLASATETSPVFRGKFVRERLLCQQMPAPPANFTVPPADPNAVTMRQRLAVHDSSAACSSCHTLMDPIGLTFEGFDSEGRARTTEAGLPIDTSGQLNRAPDTATDGPLSGPLDLAQKLAQSVSVQQCAVLQWFRFGMGRAEQAGDACSLQAAADAFNAGGGNFQQLLVSLTTTDAFLYRTSRVAEGGEP